MPQSSNVLSFVPVPNLEPGQRRSSATPPKSAGIEDEAVLRKIAEAALSATGAEGAALALRRDGAVVCVARAGEMAPPLGARLDDTSGMSGECLREGQPLRCDDTETDTRVDAEACRDLGLRSLAVAAVKEDDNVIGILEVFSPQPLTFTDRHMEVLRQLAELVVAESAAESSEVESPPVAKSPPDTPSTATVPQPRLLPPKAPEEPPTTASAVSAPALPAKAARTAISATPLLGDVNISAYLAAHEKAQSQGPPRIPKLVLVGLATIIVASFVGWYIGHRTPSGPVTTAAVQSAARLPGPDAPTAAGTISPDASQANPSAGSTSNSNPREDGRGNSKSARDSLTNAASKNRIASDSVDLTKPVRVVPSPGAVDSDSEAAPGLPVATADGKLSDPVSALLNTPAALPVRAPPVSQGVEGGELETKVNAIYPPQARAAGQHGVVVVEALVGADGSVKDVKVVSGPPMLRESAMDAVRRWKYQPFKLNGKAIAAQTQVQVEFKLQ
jgi:TonB family protein